MNSLNRATLYNYNLYYTLLGGQSFTWDYKDGIYYGFTQDKAIFIKDLTNFGKPLSEHNYNEVLIEWQTYPIKDDREWLERYLRLNVDYEKVIKSISHVEQINSARAVYGDLRLLEQGLDLALLTFLISPTKSIPGIRQCVRNLANKYGETVLLDSGGKVKVKLFPKTDLIAELSEKEMRAMMVGFRAPNIISAARMLSNEKFIKDVEGGTTAEATNILKTLRGVGDKVADCVAVYGLARDDTTPFDIWGIRYMEQYFNIAETTKHDIYREKMREVFGANSSWAGQFLFEYIRESHRKIDAGGVKI